MSLLLIKVERKIGVGLVVVVFIGFCCGCLERRLEAGGKLERKKGGREGEREGRREGGSDCRRGAGGKERERRRGQGPS
jgi:hypothetical protein